MHTPPAVLLGLQSGASDKEPGDAGDMGLIPGSGRFPGDGNGSPHQRSCLENTMDKTAWWATSMGLQESDTTERLHFHALEKEMAAHSSVLAWRIPGTGDRGGLLSVGLHRVGHD